ncbi:MAG: nuclear transport factor 2 family protein [Solirubrobacteraceae bacterium]
MRSRRGSRTRTRGARARGRRATWRSTLPGPAPHGGHASRCRRRNASGPSTARSYPVIVAGEQALRRYYVDWSATLDDVRADVDGVLLEDGKRVAVAVRNEGRGRTSGVPVQGRYYVACLVRDGRIVAGREYATAKEAVEGACSLRWGANP